MSDDEGADTLKATNIRKLLANLNREARVRDDEIATSDKLYDIEQLLALLRKGGMETSGSGLKTVTIKRGAICSFCKRSLASTDSYVKGRGSVVICASCLEECSKVLADDDLLPK